MKILQINLCRAVGGSSYHHADLALGLSEAGHEVCVIDRLGDFTPQNTGRHVQHVLTRRGAFHIDIWRTLREFKPDIVHAHQSLAARLANRLGNSIPVISTIHGAYKARSYKSSNGIIRVADHQKAAMQNYTGPSVTIWNWLRKPQQEPLSKHDARRVLDIPQNAYIFGFVGRILEAKGIFELIGAFQSIKDTNAKLVIIGDGPDRAQAAEMAKHDPRITFTGFRSDASTLMSAFDCFVMPSHAEAFPLVLIEALNAGCDIIATETLGAKEMLGSLEFDLLKIKDTEALGMKLHETMAEGLPSKVVPSHFLSEFSREYQISKTIRFYSAVSSYTKAVI
jgi:glycosyltransferase involved in cell wall biosynthesis